MTRDEAAGTARVTTLDVVVANPRGIHARAAARIVKLMATFDAKVSVAKDGVAVGADSILGLMMLAAGAGAALTLKGTGRQGREAVTALAELLAREDMEET